LAGSDGGGDDGGDGGGDGDDDGGGGGGGDGSGGGTNGGGGGGGGGSVGDDGISGSDGEEFPTGNGIDIESDDDSDDGRHNDSSTGGGGERSWQTKERNFLTLFADPNRGGEPGIFLSQKNILEAVTALNDPLLDSALACAFDRHSQAVTMYFLCNTALWKKLEELGHFRDSVVLKILGRALQAYSRPGLTFEERTKALFLQQELIKAAMGTDMFDVRVLSRMHYGGFVLHQLLDFIGMVDVRNQALALVPHLLNERGCDLNTETWLATKILESSFSLIASNPGGRKMTAKDLFGRIHNLEVAAEIRADSTRGFAVRRSKRKWKQDDLHTDGYNDGNDMGWDQDEGPWGKETGKRAKRSSRNRATVRTLNRAAGGT
jgi:hypothetical protein